MRIFILDGRQDSENLEGTSAEQTTLARGRFFAAAKNIYGVVAHRAFDIRNTTLAQAGIYSGGVVNGKAFKTGSFKY